MGYSMLFSNYLSKVEGSKTAQVFAHAKKLEAQGKEVIHLEIGQPEFVPPIEVLEATKAALSAGKTTYTVSKGLNELRKAISDFYANELNVSLDPDTEIVVTAGAKISIFAALWSVVNAGDNVIILNPSWVSYADIVASLGGEPRFLGVEDDFAFDLVELEKLMDERSKAVILNSPSNPTGATISHEMMKALYELCSSKGILVVSDEIYSDYVFDGKHNSLMDLPNWKEYGVVINGFSKTFSMTGFRLGYALANPELSKQINKVMQLTSSCPVNFVQWGAITALKHIGSMRNYIQSNIKQRRDKMTTIIQSWDKDFKAPKGGIYGWIKIPSDNSIQWAEQLLDQAGVAVTPGRAFGPDGEGYIRICFAVNENRLSEGLKRIQSFINKKERNNRA